jgi:hypothetical protein
LILASGSKLKRRMRLTKCLVRSAQLPLMSQQQSLLKEIEMTKKIQSEERKVGW